MNSAEPQRERKKNLKKCRRALKKGNAPKKDKAQRDQIGRNFGKFCNFFFSSSSSPSF
jgi:hypothetical protein